MYFVAHLCTFSTCFSGDQTYVAYPRWQRTIATYRVRRVATHVGKSQGVVRESVRGASHIDFYYEKRHCDVWVCVCVCVGGGGGFRVMTFLMGNIDNYSKSYIKK